MRNPFVLGWSRSEPIRAPALISSSVQLTISDIIFSSGCPPDSKSLVALTSKMKRIIESPSGLEIDSAHLGIARRPTESTNFLRKPGGTLKEVPFFIETSPLPTEVSQN